jgi:hypothetical protein
LPPRVSHKRQNSYGGGGGGSIDSNATVENPNMKGTSIMVKSVASQKQMPKNQEEEKKGNAYKQSGNKLLVYSTEQQQNRRKAFSGFN